MGQSHRAHLMARTRLEHVVVDRGVWQLDLSVPRDMSERPRYFSLESNWRSYERMGIMGLTGIGAAYRVQSKIPDLDPAGTLPEGEEEGFWVRMEEARASLRDRAMATDVHKRLHDLEQGRSMVHYKNGW